MPDTPDSKTPAEPALPRLLNITEVADALGVEARHIRRLIHERRIPYIKWGHLIRFDPDSSPPGSASTASPAAPRRPTGDAPLDPQSEIDAAASSDGSESAPQRHFGGYWPR